MARELTYTPDPDTFGTDSFSYTVNDGTFDSNEGTVVIEVEGVNDAPVAVDVSAEVPEDAVEFNILITATDAETDSAALMFSVRGVCVCVRVCVCVCVIGCGS